MNNTIKILSYNIRYHNPADGEHSWPHRKEKVAALLQRYTPDLIGLQEVLKGQLDDIAGALTDFAWVGVGRDDGRARGEYAPIFYRRNRFALLASDTFWLSETPHQPGSFGWDAACVRIATWARLRDKASGATFLVLNTHFDHRGEQAQVESARLLRAFLNDPAQALPAVVTGDFNGTAQAWSYQVLTQPTEAAGLPLADAMLQSQTPHHGPVATFTTGFADPLQEKIDFIFVWPAPSKASTAAIQVQRHAVLDDQVDGYYPSDHLPVLAAVTF